MHIAGECGRGDAGDAACHTADTVDCVIQFIGAEGDANGCRVRDRHVHGNGCADDDSGRQRGDAHAHPRLGSVAGLEIEGAPFFVGQPENNGGESPEKLGITSTRIEMFCDDPDALIIRAIEAGAAGSVDRTRNHQMPWGTHRQGGFVDPFGHRWLVGDRSPLAPFPRPSTETSE